MVLNSPPFLLNSALRQNWMTLLLKRRTKAVTAEATNTAPNLGQKKKISKEIADLKAGAE